MWIMVAFALMCGWVVVVNFEKVEKRGPCLENPDPWDVDVDLVIVDEDVDVDGVVQVDVDGVVRVDVDGVVRVDVAGFGRKMVAMDGVEDGDGIGVVMVIVS